MFELYPEMFEKESGHDKIKETYFLELLHLWESYARESSLSLDFSFAKYT